MDVTRRNFLLSTTAAAAGATLAGQTPGAGAQAPTLVAQAAAYPAPRGFNPADPALKFDIVIANGDVLDPSQKPTASATSESSSARSPRSRRAFPPTAPFSRSTPPASSSRP